jgi:hypothetical protein
LVDDDTSDLVQIHEADPVPRVPGSTSILTRGREGCLRGSRHSSPTTTATTRAKAAAKASTVSVRIMIARCL